MKEVKTSEQWGNNQAQFVQLGCVKSNLHLSWICQCWQGTLDAEPTVHTLQRSIIVQQRNLWHVTIAQFAGVWWHVNCQNVHLKNLQHSKAEAFLSPYYPIPLRDSVKYITAWRIGREWAKGSEVWILAPTPESMWLNT